MKWMGLFRKPSASAVSEEQRALVALRRENQRLQQECWALKLKLEMMVLKHNLGEECWALESRLETMTLKHNLAQKAVQDTLAAVSPFPSKP
jgi:hypothetical protein